jgi:hypothetical protein
LSSGMIKFLLTVVVTNVFWAGFAAGQKAQLDPHELTALSNTEEVATPSGTPEPQVAPDLLPESNRLPAEPPDLRLPSPSFLKVGSPNGTPNVRAVEQISPEEQEKNRARLAELRVVAMRNPKVINLLKQANEALSDEAKRGFMRAYCHTLCTRMRRLEPTLGPTINAFERAEIRKLAAGPSHIAIASRDPLRKERPRRGRQSE